MHDFLILSKFRQHHHIFYNYYVYIMHIDYQTGHYDIHLLHNFVFQISNVEMQIIVF
jgi:hypothetical protein